jgi:hypothetical protein
MPTLTFERSEKAVPMAVVRGGDDDGKVLSLLDDRNHSPSDIKLEGESKFEVLPSIDPEKRQVFYIAGQSGSGKSYFCRKLCEKYAKLFPNRSIYLISKLQHDDTLDSMTIGRPKRISLDSLVEDYPALEEFEDCMVVFDDFDTLDKPYITVVQKLIDDLAIQGRHTRTSMCVLSHYLSNYKKTRLILSEAQYLVVYPMSTSARALISVATSYGGLDPDQAKELKRLGRWACIYKNYPGVVIAEQRAFLPNQQ